MCCQSERTSMSFRDRPGADIRMAAATSRTSWPTNGSFFRMSDGTEEESWSGTGAGEAVKARLVKRLPEQFREDV
eukprot:10146772-Prorocentrum_lima.AAC.1